MMKRIRLSICCILTLVLILSFTATSAFAANTKSVNVSSTTNFTCTWPEVGSNVQSIQNSTYSYDDGYFRGTLGCSQINSLNYTAAGKNSNNVDIYNVTVNATFSGIVTRYNPIPEKSVYMTIDRTFTCQDSQVAANMQAIQSSTYNYNDGAYQGILNYQSISNASVTVVGHNSEGDILQFNVKVNYSGTVTFYN